MPTKAKKPATLKDEDTGLDIVGEGKNLRLSIKTMKQAKAAISVYAQNEEELEVLLRKVAPLNAKREMIRAGLKEFQEKNEVADLVHDGWVSQLIERMSNMWVLHDTDIPEAVDLSKLEDKVVSLDDIILEKSDGNPKLYRKLLNKVTKRVIDPTALDSAVKDGTFTAQEIEPAFLEYVGTSYVQVKPENKPKVKK